MKSAIYFHLQTLTSLIGNFILPIYLYINWIVTDYVSLEFRSKFDV